MAIIGGALVVVFGVLVLIVWKSDRRLAGQHRRELALAASAAEANARSEAKTRFLANIGHELRTPLNAIIGFSDFIAKGAFGPVSPARYADYANDINGSGLRLLGIINDILDIVNCESDRLELRYARKPLGRLVADTLRQVAEEAEQSGVQMVNEVTDVATELHCDPARLQQALGSLLSNAVRFTRPGGTVRVTATRGSDGSLILAVIDDGIGIPAADLPRIMEPFQQVDSGLARKYDGVGLGIPLARAIARLHGGDIVYESEEGRGTTARLMLPASCVIPAEPLRKSA
jgi:signal transduction histidine kinase